MLTSLTNHLAPYCRFRAGAHDLGAGKVWNLPGQARFDSCVH